LLHLITIHVFQSPILISTSSISVFLVASKTNQVAFVLLLIFNFIFLNLQLSPCHFIISIGKRVLISKLSVFSAYNVISSHFTTIGELAVYAFLVQSLVKYGKIFIFFTNQFLALSKALFNAEEILVELSFSKL
jgi:hypothetical protein